MTQTHPVRTRSVISLLRKDILLELRQQYALFGVLLYVASTVFVLYLLVDAPEYRVWNALFWVMQLFVCVNAVARSFLQDARGRMLYYQTIASPAEFMASKLLFNLLLMGAMNTVVLLVYVAFMGDPTYSLWRFAGISYLGSMGLAMVFTLLAAIASRAQQQASLMAILGFPIILPHLLLLSRLSRSAFAEAFREGAGMQAALLLLSLDAAVAVLSLILYPFLWRD